MSETMSGKEMRRLAHEQKNIKKDNNENAREDFRKFFITLKRKLNLGPELENVIWLHLKAIKMDTKEQFEDGIRNFGYKI